jgi:hypothetical protein
MFTREEALALWDALLAENDAFLYAFGELVLTRANKAVHAGFVAGTDKPGGFDNYGYFVRAKNHCYTKEMLAAFERVCNRHGCTYRIETDERAGITFYKERK